MHFSAPRKFVKESHIAGGFTLIELLVVIAIIALLMAVATVSYTNVQMKARDSRRKANLADISQALARFYADNGAYPQENDDFVEHRIATMTCITTGATSSNNSITWGGSFKSLGSTGLCDGPKTYMSQVPDDPNYPGQDPTIANDHGYVYEVYKYKYGNFTNAPQGWCRDTGTHDANWTQITDKCQHFTLWTTLENPNDPDIQKTLADPICKLAIRYGGIWADPAHLTPPIGSGVLEWYGNPNDVPSSPGENYWKDYWTTPSVPINSTKGWAYWAYEDPDRPPSPTNDGSGTRNYCVHD